MKSKLKIGATLITRTGTAFTIYEIKSFDIIVKGVKNNTLETVPISRGIDYIKYGWWKFIANPNQIWKELNEA